MSRSLAVLPRFTPGGTRSFRAPVQRSLFGRNPYALNRQNGYAGYADLLKALRHRFVKPSAVQPKPVMCLLVAAHNEELVLATTLRSAIAGGMAREHIYVVDDHSGDRTSEIARSILPHANVFKVGRSGKGLALSRAAAHFKLPKRYRWIHIADADGAFAHDYFAVFRQQLKFGYAAATGYIRSLQGKRISEYRVYEYTVGMELYRRVQALLGVISIIPGPTSCFRADVFEKLDFTNKALTEDFDVTLQIYRLKLGKIQFIPQAVAYTQDPLTIRAFLRQITRWNRGVMQGIVRHKIGRRFSPIDAYLMYQVGQSLLLFLNCFVWVPYMSMGRGGPAFASMTFLLDVLMTFFIVILVAMRTKRWEIISAFPVIYGIKWLSLGVFIKAFFEVVVLRKFRLTTGAWESGTARYQLQPAG